MGIAMRLGVLAVVAGVVAACGSANGGGASDVGDSSSDAGHSVNMPVTPTDGGSGATVTGTVASDGDASDLGDASDGSAGVVVVTPPPPEDDAGEPADSSSPVQDAAPDAPASVDAAGVMKVHCAVTDPVTKNVTVYVGCNGETDPHVATITWQDSMGTVLSCTQQNAASIAARENCPTGTACGVHTPSFDGNGTCQ